jgi:hypothetical protein
MIWFDENGQADPASGCGCGEAYGGGNRRGDGGEGYGGGRSGGEGFGGYGSGGFGYGTADEDSCYRDLLMLELGVT